MKPSIIALCRDHPCRSTMCSGRSGWCAFHAAEWHIDPHKIGVLGFSAGGHLVALVSTHFDRRVYVAVDTADQEGSCPDFAVALYPGHLFDYDKDSLNADLHVTKSTPPLKDAGVPTELLLYAEAATRSGCGERRFRLPPGRGWWRHGCRRSG